MYRPPSQTNFFEILNMTFEKVDMDKKEIYILGNFNINMYHNNRCDLLQEKGPSNFTFLTAFRRSQLSLTEFQRF